MSGSLMNTRQKLLTYLESVGEVASINSHDLELNDPFVRFVLEGEMTLYAAAPHIRQFLGVVGPQKSVLSISPKPDQGMNLVGWCTSKTRVITVPLDQYKQLIQNSDFQEEAILSINEWIETLSKSAWAFTLGSVKADMLLSPNHAYHAFDGEILKTKQAVLWITVLEGSGYLQGKIPLEQKTDPLFVISRYAWVQVMGSLQFETHSVQTVCIHSGFWDAVMRFGAATLQICQANHHIEAEKTIRLIKNWNDQSQFEIRYSFQRLKQILFKPRFFFTSFLDPVYAAVQCVAKEKGISIKSLSVFEPTEADCLSQIEKVAFYNRLLSQRVRITQNELKNGAIIAVYQHTQKPVVLLKFNRKKVHIFDPCSGHMNWEWTQVTETLLDQGITVLNTVDEKNVGTIKLLNMGLKGHVSKVITSSVFIFFSAILWIGFPAALFLLMRDIIPQGDLQRLMQIGVILSLSSLMFLSLQVAVRYSVLNIEAVLSYRWQLGLWHGLLQKPLAFFKSTPSVQLGRRALSLHAKGPEPWSLAVVKGVSQLYWIFYLIFMSIIDWQLTLYFVVPFTVLFFSVYGWVMKRDYFEQQKQRDHQEVVSEFLLQSVSAIDKIKSTFIKSKVFSMWAVRFSSAKKASVRTFFMKRVGSAVLSGIALSGFAIGFILLAYHPSSVGFRSVYYFLLLHYIWGLKSISNSAWSFRDVQSITVQENESDRDRIKLRKFFGNIEFSHVGFQYPGQKTFILDQVNAVIQEREWVVITGLSGVGKSTVLRLLLGLENPTSGAIYVEGQDLSKLNLHYLRKKMGILLQTDSLFPGTIFSNIVRTTEADLNSVWEVLQQVGLDQDIKKTMPMGLYTVVNEGSTAFSSSQIQCILLARALISIPSLLVLDEPTAFLDFQLQQQVLNTLETIPATKVIVSSHPEIIKRADRVYGFENSGLKRVSAII